MTISRVTVLAYRSTVHGLAFERESPVGGVEILNIGIQDTGPDGSAWAMRIRGARPGFADEVALLWTIRGAPHLYRRSQLPQVAAATAPYSEADAAKRIFDAAKPLREAGIPVLEALDFVAARMREIVTEPTVKGDLSGALTRVLPEPYLRFCRPCDTIHIYEMPFRLAATRAGLELEPATSPPVLTPGFRGAAPEYADHLDLVRGYLHFFGPTHPKQVAAYLDAPVKDIRARWPADSVEVTVEVGDSREQRWVLADDEETVRRAEPPAVTVLLGPFDPYLQVRDRKLLVTEPRRRNELWPTLGRPGAVMSGGELVAAWRPRKAGKKLVVRLQPWRRLPARTRSAIRQEAERLGEFRGASSVEVIEDD